MLDMNIIKRLDNDSIILLCYLANREGTSLPELISEITEN